MAKRRSFFERLTGGMRFEDDAEFRDAEFDDDDVTVEPVLKNARTITPKSVGKSNKNQNVEETEKDEVFGELSVDVYETASDIVVQTMIAGVRPEDMEISITRDMIVIRGKREDKRLVDDEHFFSRELYWGAFSRTIALPEEIDPDGAEATEKHGLLTLKLPKLDKNRQTTLKIKSI